MLLPDVFGNVQIPAMNRSCEGPERVDELFIRKLCLMFQFPDTEMMEKFSKKLQIVQEKFLVVRSVRWYHYNGLRR